MKKVYLHSSGAILRNGLNLDDLKSNILAGQTVTDEDDLSIRNYNTAKEFGDRRLMRAIADKDILGLVALNRCDPSPVEGTQPERLGIYVGAQVPTTSDNSGYNRAVAEANGHEENFGSKIGLAHPMTLLTSLANNVLCYAAIKHNARGVNSNYTNMEISSHVALMNAFFAIQNDKADACFVGGYSMLTREAPYNKMIEKQGYISDSTSTYNPLSGESVHTRLADGAVFTTLSHTPSSIEIVDVDTCCDQSGPFHMTSESAYLVDMIHAVLKRNDLDMSKVGGLFLSGHGASKTDRLELEVLDTFKSENKDLRAFSVGKFTGNLTEAGGLLELALSEEIKNNPLLRAAVSLDGESKDLNSPYILHVRTGIWGDHSCVLAKFTE